MAQSPRHTLADHQLGALAGHAHEGDEDHDHEHDGDPRHELIESGSRALEGAPFVSIGIDVGSATTQIVFSRLVMRGPGEPPALRRLVKSRETIWLSQPALTPWMPDGTIDAEGVRDLVDAAFAASGVSPDDVETGAAIVTGDAARAADAPRLLAVLAEETGELVAAVAGHRLEAVLAAWGSGAVGRSLAESGRILLIDLGGGTAKLALVQDGRIERVAALSLGSRAAVFDEDGALLRLTAAGEALARLAGGDWTTGERVSASEVARMGDAMAGLLTLALVDPKADVLTEFWLTEPLDAFDGARGLMASGGVAEYVYGRETRDFGDLGAAFGHALRRRIDAGELGVPLIEEGEGLRATVFGAAEHSVQASGETGFVSAPGRLLPRRDLPAAAPAFDLRGDFDPRVLAAAIGEARRLADLSDAERDFVLALRWRGEPAHARLLALAEGVVHGLGDRIDAGRPLYLILEGDVALNLAGVLRQELGVENDMLVLDGVVLREFDHVDIGRLRSPSNIVPVTVKTLLFAERQRGR